MLAYLNEVDKPALIGVSCEKKEKAIASRIRKDTNIEEKLIPTIYSSHSSVGGLVAEVQSFAFRFGHTNAKMLIKCGYFTFTNAAIEPHLISTQL